MDENDRPNVSRRALLRASSGAVALSAVGSARASDGSSDVDRAASALSRRCPDATLRPSMGHCEGASLQGCADDHPATVDLRNEVRRSLERRYPDVGALVDAGFKPYFDTLERDDDGWSHWLHPEYIGDDTVVDPDRPESVLVDNDSWRSIGVMFIAARDGEPVDPPPAVYDAEDDGESVESYAVRTAADGDDEHGYSGGGEHGHDSDGEHDGNGDHHPDGDEGRCSPWHYHAGLPGRFAWWYYQQAYERRFRDANLEFPCRTPCVMHVWTVDHPESVYAHDGPPSEYRDQEPADDPGFDTGARPGEDELGWDALPDDLVPERLPNEFSMLGP